jgi:hypothetical protein
VSLPPVTLFTFQMTIEFVPPETDAENCVAVTTLMAIVTGEIVTVMLVTGSVHEEEDEAVELDPEVVVQVTAVLAAEPPHEAKLIAAMINAKRERLFTAPRYSIAGNSILRVRALLGARRNRVRALLGASGNRARALLLR